MLPHSEILRIRTWTSEFWGHTLQCPPKHTLMEWLDTDHVPFSHSWTPCCTWLDAAVAHLIPVAPRVSSLLPSSQAFFSEGTPWIHNLISLLNIVGGDYQRTWLLRAVRAPHTIPCPWNVMFCSLVPQWEPFSMTRPWESNVSLRPFGKYSWLNPIKVSV